MEEFRNIPFFFIIGRARSGTTLLRTLFDAHPNVKIPLEAPLIQELSKAYFDKKIWTKSDIEQFYQQLTQVKDFDKWGMPKDVLKKTLLNFKGATTFKELINAVYYHSPSIFDKQEILLLGDKNPVYSVNIEKIFHLYPKAKYIHLQRDYRPHIQSMLKAKLYSNNIVALAYRWKYSARKIARLKKKHPASFFSLKYEDLVHDPANYLKQLCEFLGIDYCPSALSFHKKTQLVEQRDTEGKIELHHKRIFQPIDTNKVDVWKKEMNKTDIKIADFVVGPWAKKEGYQREFSAFSIAFRIRHWPKILLQKLFYIYRWWWIRIKG